MKEDIDVRKKIYTPVTGLLYGALPKGCALCAQGTKIVVFVTGICGEDCWYCPVSREKYGKDYMYVDDEKATSINDIVLEAYRVAARGAGITGGDPLAVPDRVIRIIRRLKQEFGEAFHIHLYTTGRRLTRSMMKALVDAGLDEIRFHTYSWELYEKALMALEYPIDAGLELPFIPIKKYIDYLEELIKRADRDGFLFINLDELEVSEANIDKVVMHGLKPMGLTVYGIREKALDFITRISHKTQRITIHYCTAVYKDSIQFRMRNFRKAVTTAPISTVVSSTGTIIRFKYNNKIINPLITINLSKHYIVEEYLPTTKYGVLNRRRVIPRKGITQQRDNTPET